ncbi:hypothetical protein FIM02_01340 [SAR202 cluster bacterium AD-802-E10_MRT_200m]|nr:hypothetical protein [SAR202 cluster bacterium AD-802-E10_MRT_200m]MQF82789.1 hypothetical protein [SAR202 cluster bacterium AD-802-E10_MRT_200m]
MYNAAVWLASAQSQASDTLEINWRSFSLEQANNKEGPDWKIWDQPSDYPSRGFLALRAGEAARLQGESAFNKFHLALLKARHEDRQKIADTEVLVNIAASVGLDIERFKQDLQDESLITKIKEDHIEAVEQHGVFGTPTFVFQDGASAFLKLLKPPDQDAPRLLEILAEVMGKWNYIGEIKRPQPPWPKGVYE